MTFIEIGATSTQLHAAANLAAAQLPLIGIQNPKTEVYLCHFSADPNIQMFNAESLVCNWLNGFSTAAHRLGRLTDIINIQAVNSLYVIRVGIDVPSPLEQSTILPVCHSKFGAYEFALNLNVPDTHFSCIPMTYIPSTDSFE